MKRRRIGIFGGSFDPIHIGHLILADEASRQLKLERVIFVPARIPPHKPPCVAGGRHRLAMVRIACAGDKRFEVSPVEIDRPGRSYAIDTLREFRKRYGRNTRIYFITGSDSLAELGSWKDIGTVLKLCTFAAVARPGHPAVRPRYAVRFLKMPLIGISSSLLRERLKAGLPILYYTPAGVCRYIMKKKPYKRRIGLDVPVFS